MITSAIATIDLPAIYHNFSVIKEHLPGKKILAMIKSNGYGHGLIPVAKTLSTADALGVATLSEALTLRENGIHSTIVVMRGFATQEELSIFIQDPHLIPCVHHHSQLQLLKNLTAPLSIWLKIDTGMHRLGFSVAEFDLIYRQLNAISFIEKNFVICTHLADADNPDTSFTQQQMAAFKHATKNTPNPKSILNSAGIVAHINSCIEYSKKDTSSRGESPRDPGHTSAVEWIRPGIMLYGASPFALDNPQTAFFNRLRPAMTLSSTLLSIKTISVGEKIGYSCTYEAKKEMRIGIVGIGYGDGYLRNIQTGAPVLLHGKRCFVVGRVSMDMIAIDLSAVPEAAINDAVILWGTVDLSVTEVAHHANSIAHDLLCHSGNRVDMRY
ncbi:MAG: alanine racemase [Gammaproteobacteria bacterium RIFCSPHIGHO2_12_FULL_42_13]|nr:MAG: alanine racemase [Gammaproteobacteria bacterium RIFCSPHIGHO2_12_FULL_42_13]